MRYPHIQTLYARSGRESAYPHLWRGLVGAWVFGMQSVGIRAPDFSGRGVHGSLLGNPVYSPGKYGRSLTFDGVDDYVDTGRTVGALIGASENTISCWIKPTGVSIAHSNPYGLPAAVAETDGYMGIVRGTVSQSGKGGGDAISVWNWNSDDFSVHMTYNVDEWIHVTRVHTGGVLYGYKNGILAGSISVGDTDDTSGTLTIGRGFTGASGTTEFWIGSIDDVRMYNRALSPSEIWSTYSIPYGLWVPQKRVISAVMAPSPTAASIYYRMLVS